MHQARSSDVATSLRGERVQVREPVVDHLRLRGEGQLVDGELTEAPLAALVGPAADLEDHRLTALARERREVVVEVLQELEVDERLDLRGMPPHLRAGDHPLWPNGLSTG